jgi:hypothetical protein
VITQAWLNAWEHVIPFLAFPDEVRRVIYTTDESVKGREPDFRVFECLWWSGVLAEGDARRQGRRRNLGPGGLFWCRRSRLSVSGLAGSSSRRAVVGRRLTGGCASALSLDPPNEAHGSVRA